MKNADMPAMPSSHCTNSPVDGDMVPGEWAGLSKREHFAAMAMQSLAKDESLPTDEAAKLAVKYADQLLAELERTS